jgi:glutathione S-transferase
MLLLSTCSLASHIVLGEARARSDLMKIDLSQGEQSTELYLKIIPNGRVPALVFGDGRAIFENIGTMTRRGRRSGGAKLIPTPFEATRCYSLMSFSASSVRVAFAHNARPNRYPTQPAEHLTMRETWLKSLWNCLQMIDGWLKGRDWLFERKLHSRPMHWTICGWAVRGEASVLWRRDRAFCLAG